MTEDDVDDRLDAVLHRLGERVRAMRLARGMSITGLSFEAAVSEDHLRAIEAGRTAAPLPVLIALADVFEVGVADLFGDGAAPVATSDAIDAPHSSPHVVPSPVIWGGALPPAPWMTSAPAQTTPVAAAAPASPVPTPATSVAPPAVAAVTPQSASGDGGLPPAPWQVTQPVADPSAATPVPPLSPPPRVDVPPPVSSAAPRVHQRAAERGMQGESPYVFVAPGAGRGVVPRTFADLRTGPLEGRNFRSLQEFAVASVVQAQHAIPDVARVFRVPVWRLEQWVRESGHAV